MQDIRIVAIPTQVAEKVRETMQAPIYCHPAHVETGSDAAPCRHCLRLINAGEQRILFTYDRFSGVESLPLPGPVYVHDRPCPRYAEDGGFPNELRSSPRTLEGYAHGRRLVVQSYVTDGNPEPVIEKIFAHHEVDYIHVNSTTAGCHTFRIEKRIPKAR